MRFIRPQFGIFGLCCLLISIAACSNERVPDLEHPLEHPSGDTERHITPDGGDPPVTQDGGDPPITQDGGPPITQDGAEPSFTPEKAPPLPPDNTTPPQDDSPKDSGGNTSLPLAGEVTRTLIGQPSSKLSTVCEYGNAWRLHSQHGQNVSVVPQRQYLTSCRNAKGVHLFVSIPVDDGSARTQYVYEAMLNEATGAYTLTGNALHMSQCEDASGLAATPDCSAVAVLCHRAYGSSTKEKVDQDLITPYAGNSTSERGWVLRADNQANKDTNTEMWLYEYPGATFSATPKKFLVHKAVRATNTARGLGQYYLKYSPDHDTYGMALRTSMFTTGGSRHVADAFLIIKRGATPNAWSIDPAKGYPWGCGKGHTDINHPGYNPVSKQFAITCRTDIAGGLYFRTDTMGDPQSPFHRVSQGGNQVGGGATSFASLPDGGFLLALVGNPIEEVQIDD